MRRSLWIIGNQELAQEHLLYALLTQDDSLIAKLMEKMGLDKNMVINRVEDVAERKLPKVQGGQQYVGQASEQCSCTCGR